MRLRSKLAPLVAACVAALVVAGGGSAITNGQPDGDRHPYVGLMIALDEDDIPLWGCTGSLLSPTVYLTAGHCTELPADRVVTWFDPGPIATDPDYLAAVDAAGALVPCDDPAFDGYPCGGDAAGEPTPNPDFCFACAPSAFPGIVRRDVGIVLLAGDGHETDADVYAELPSPGRVDDLPKKAAVDFVGYGSEFQLQIPGKFLPQPPPFYRWDGTNTRMFAPSQLVSGKFANNDEVIRIALNASQGSGGACFGDSGGPDLVRGTHTVIGINSYLANVNCSGVGYSSRVDIPEVLTWINGFLD
jgi:hypothetical protein